MSISYGKYAIIVCAVWFLLGFRLAIFALMGAAAYDLWKFLRKSDDIG
jgi:hypothetical protein